MKEYGFRLLDKVTSEIVQDWQWLTTPEARAHVIRQSTIDGQHIIQKEERETTLEMGDAVRIVGGDTRVFRIVGIGPTTFFKLQVGNDAATWQTIDGSKLELVEKVKRPEGEPGFVPGRSINDVGY
jgi:hypothetical protein